MARPTIVWDRPSVQPSLIFQDLLPGEFFVWAEQYPSYQLRLKVGKDRYFLMGTDMLKSLPPVFHNDPVRRVKAEILATLE